MNTETQEWVAIKVLDKEKIQKQNMGAQVKKEISIMKLVRHPHVVQLKEVLASRTKIFIVLELVTGGELFDLIVQEGRFKEKTARFYFQQLVVGTQYCHSRGVWAALAAVEPLSTSPSYLNSISIRSFLTPASDSIGVFFELLARIVTTRLDGY